MAKKKNPEVVVEPTFNMQQAITELNCSEMLKSGLGYYFEVNKITIKNQKDFDKQVKKYFELKIGE